MGRVLFVLASSLVGWAAALAACGGEATRSAAPLDAGQDTGSPPSVPGPPLGPELGIDAGPALGFGRVFANRSFSSGGNIVGSVAGEFFWAADQGEGMPSADECTERVIAGCTFSECAWKIPPSPGDPDYDAGTPSDAGSDASATRARPEAGRLTVTAAPAKSVTIDPAPGFNSYTPARVGTAWAAGTELRAQAAGGVVPAFDLTLAAPSMIKVTEPVYPTDGPIKIAQASALTLRWQPAGGDTAATGTVRVSISWIKTVPGPTGLPREAESKTALCRFDASAGAGSIAPEVLAAFPKDRVVLDFYTRAETTRRIGDWDITFAAAGERERTESPWKGQADIE